MSVVSKLLDEKRRTIVDFLSTRGITEVRVVGSIARGDSDDESDIDLLVELPGTRTAGSELLEVLELSDRLSAIVGTRVDVVTAGSLRPDVRSIAQREAIPL